MFVVLRAVRALRVVRKLQLYMFLLCSNEGMRHGIAVVQHSSIIGGCLTGLGTTSTALRYIVSIKHTENQ